MLKRIVISIVALSCLSVCYALYVRAFSRFTFPPLTPGREPPLAGGELPSDDPSQKQNYARKVAERVFGADSWQASDDTIALYWLTNGVIIFIKEYERVDEQSLRLTPFCLVYTEPPKTPGGTSQIVTLLGRDAVLEFDRTIDLFQVTGARPVGGRISGNVQVHADRATEDPLDDFVAYTEYLEFREDEKRIWTEAPVRIVSADSVMTGTGGELYLKMDDDKKKSHDTIAFDGARGFALFKDVQINMLASASDGLAPVTPSKPNRAGATQEPKRMPVSISCDGPFKYDLETARAEFHRSVQMLRQTSDGQFDRLFCDDLGLTFDKKSKEELSEPAPENNAVDLKFREAHATGRSVRILSDEEGFEAIGTEMHHDASAAQSILRGEPEVVAAKAGNVIHGRELRFTTVGPGQRIGEAVGPGNLEARDDVTHEVRLRGHWNEWARMEPQTAERQQQIIALEGEVEIEQPGRGSMNADRIKVWLDRAKKTAESGKPASGADDSSWAPSRIEGIGHVKATGDEFEIEAPGRLDMVFEDGPLPSQPRVDPNLAADANTTTKPQPPQVASTAPAAGTKRNRAVNQAGAPTKEQPVHLRADTIRIKALRDGPRTELAEANAQGNVDLLQPSASETGTPLVVQGKTLYVRRVVEGNHMEVTGSPAHVEMNGVKLDGAQVGMDQPAGVAWAEGKGAMAMPSDTTLDGKKLATPAVMTITWTKFMWFNGSVAAFGGNVEARQDAASVRCQQLEAFLVEPVDIGGSRQGARQTAKVKQLVCTTDVQLEESVAADGRLEKFEYLEAPWLEFSLAEGVMKAKGPGLVRMYTRGNANFAFAPDPAAKPGKPGAAPNPPSEADDQLYMTEVQYSDRMEGVRAQQIARFWGHIELVHSPVANEHEMLDPDKLPTGGMRMSCEELEIGTREGPAKKSYREMNGSGNVRVESREFYGNGDRISYNQYNDLLIFESRPGSLASLYRVIRQGEKPDITRARKIFYYRREARIRVEDGVLVNIQEREADLKNNARDQNAPKPPPKKF